MTHDIKDLLVHAAQAVHNLLPQGYGVVIGLVNTDGDVGLVRSPGVTMALARAIIDSDTEHDGEVWIDKQH